MKSKLVDFFFLVFIVSIVALMFIGVWSVYNEEQTNKEKCRKIGLVYHKPFKSDGLCVEGVEIE